VTRAVALVSGGMKSAVMVAASREDYELFFLHVETGGRCAAAEQRAFDRVRSVFGAVESTVVALPHFAELVDHPLYASTTTAGDADEASGLWPGYVPGLMPALIDAAVLYALRKRAERILVGVASDMAPAGETAAARPDHTREYFQLVNEMTATLLPHHPLSVETPLIDHTLPDVVRLGNRLNVPFEVTWSCLTGREVPCEQCAGCRERTAAFVTSGVADGERRPAAARG
jgi:7-cyano-7-deazaguanine synthase